MNDDDWTTLLRRHGPALILFARQWVARHDDAEDVVQNALVRFWQAREEAADRVAYLFACVRSAAIDWRRGAARRQRREAAVAQPERTEPLFAPAVEADERRAAVEVALATLPDEQRQVLVLKIWGGLTFPQAGAALGVPANTAASRYRYALAKLREQLSEAAAP